MSEDPQTWVFPPPGAASPPTSQTGNFGPVYPNDTIILDWTPRTETPLIGLGCWNGSNHFDTDIRSDSISKGQTAPVRYTFNQRFTIKDDVETLYCHFTFTGTNNGNTVVWEFEKGKASEQRTFSSPASTNSTVSSSSNDATNSTTNSPSNNATLSAGAAVGIGVGATAFVFLVIGAGLLFWMRRRRQPFARQIPSTSSAAMTYEPVTQFQPSSQSHTTDVSMVGELEQPEYRAPARELHGLPSTIISELGDNIGTDEHIDGYKYRAS
ncbi:hypothetical protein PFICI_02410 [Pestalotiopsis fici W106-1]|uniref:Uncharacterized protein n=1 Tax=Pestalotiopsis fici (strain W106-1 / CGMCC3.15140) TaxID=1229662 RepID=W3XEA6_PESFW|nr:uncharacterized protein PFICI_02410 [Pestalotiopsis fici W106-1]ETS84385.1 hypothetical protein PFICI_02410 [Pestalotiopsis fici W106-1]